MMTSQTKIEEEEIKVTGKKSHFLNAYWDQRGMTWEGGGRTHAWGTVCYGPEDTKKDHLACEERRTLHSAHFFTLLLFPLEGRKGATLF